MQKKIGISLIVLVITIIVMTILAGAIILTLNNSGIINKATDAVEQTNLATVKELTQMAWAEVYAGGERTEEGLKAAVDKALSDNKVDTSKYVIEVTTSGVTVELKGETKVKWIQQGLTVTNGTVTLEIGDSIAYDETKGGTITGLTPTDWKVLGASEEGELLIMSTSNVDNVRLGEDEDIKKSQDDWLNAVDILDGACAPYGKGKYAIGVRSITAEDINKITGYDKTTYGKGTLYEYGNEVTISYNGTTKPSYNSTNGNSGTLNEHANGFYYYDGKSFATIDDLTSGMSGETFAILESTNYYYSGYELEEKITTSKAYTMLFGIYGSEALQYWLATPVVNTRRSTIHYGVLSLNCDEIGSFIEIFNSRASVFGSEENGVRVVVMLDPLVNVSGSSSHGWSY